jgi:protein QN1
MDQATAYWKQELEMKNQQVEKFREELDTILNVLQELKRQGVVIPL